MRNLCWIAGICILFAVSYSVAQNQPAAQPPVAAASKERAAIEALNEQFKRAFDAADAAGLAALFTEDARMSDETGKTVEGRAAIQKQLAESFRESPGAKIVLRTDSIKFLSPEVVLEEGASQLQSPSDDPADPQEFIPYTSIYVKKDGKWLHSVVRDFVLVKDDDNVASTGEDYLKELEWMLGEWVEEGATSKALSTCRWAQNKHFLVWDYTVEAEGANAPGGTTFIGWDPLTSQIKSWVFDAEGGHGEATWTRHGDAMWVVKASGVLGDGRTASATQYVALLGNDRASWTSVDRVAGGGVQPDMSEYIIARKPPKPQTSSVEGPKNR